MYTTRVTSKSITDSLIKNINMNKTKVSDYQAEISSGEKVSKPSDDVNASTIIMSSQQCLDKISTYTTNITNAKSEMDTADQSLTTCIDTVNKIKDLATQAANSTNSSAQISAISAEVDQLIKTVEDTANAKYGDKYLFGGLVTQQTPFTFTEDSTTGEITATYNGTPSTGNYQRNAEISDGVTVQTNIAGDSTFGSLFATLSNLNKALKASPTNFQDINAQLTPLQDGISTVINAQTEIGSIENRLDMTQDNLDSDKINYTKVKSSSQDADLASTISNYNMQEYALQASLQVSSSLMKKSLLDYLS